MKTKDVDVSDVAAAGSLGDPDELPLANGHDDWPPPKPFRRDGTCDHDFPLGTVFQYSLTTRFCKLPRSTRSPKAWPLQRLWAHWGVHTPI